MLKKNINIPALYNRLFMEKTIGEQRMRTDFNVSGSTLVDTIKQKTAELINLCEDLREKDDRCADYAAICFETAGMYLVKAATA